ncbi:hypothetical protein [Lapillicoccus sp.]|uniref:hypothetical protein n=1 Tax=Lapillicoccus sp. TaxID=1909287 RepID=UPI0025D773F0|nr:hypothetical protein [Lapillicoccus sp.]
MSARTGLLDGEVALLRAVQAATGPSGEPVTSPLVLEAIDDAELLGPRHAYSLLADLAVPWRRHLPLVDGVGNWGSRSGDSPADARYTLTGLTAFGLLALAADRGEVGPVPLGLVDGTWWHGGLQPPYPPLDVLRALRTRDTSGLVPCPVTGGTVAGDLEGLAAGRPTRLVLGSVLVPEQAVRYTPGMPPPGVEGGWWIGDATPLPVSDPTASGGIPTDVEGPASVDQLVVTEVPYGVDVDEVTRLLDERIRQEHGGVDGNQLHYDLGAMLPGPPIPLGPLDRVQDETTGRDGLRIVCVLRESADPEAARERVLSTWPLTITVDARLPAPLTDLVTGWDAGDGSGLSALERLLRA